jgi:serine/threonine protein kinase
MLQATKGLRAAHEKGIVHRDVKPENIFLSTGDDGAVLVKVLDFGIAKVLGTEEGAPRLTRTGMIFGTPEYMSPEQAQGQSVDHRVDIYAVGCILYQLLTGAVPFEAESFMGVLSKHMLEAPVAPRARNPAIDPAVESVVLKAMEKDPARRFQTMRELVEALTQLGPPTPDVSGPIALGSVPATATRPLLPVSQSPAGVTRPLGAGPAAAARPAVRPTEPLWTPPKALPTSPERMPLSPSNPEVRASETEIIAPPEGGARGAVASGRTRRNVWPLVAGVGALGVVAGLAAWLLAGGGAGSSASSEPPHSAPAPSASSAPPPGPAGERTGSGPAPLRPSTATDRAAPARTAEPPSAVAVPSPMAPRRAGSPEGHAEDAAAAGRKSRPAARRAASPGDDSRTGTLGGAVATPPELKNPFAPSAPAGRAP